MNATLLTPTEPAFELGSAQTTLNGDTQLSTPPHSSLPDSAEGWAPLLTRACRAHKQGIIGKGRVFHAAKSRLERGEWSRIWRLPKKDRPPATKRNGDRYALIGQEFGDANETGSSHLLSQLPDCVDALALRAHGIIPE